MTVPPSTPNAGYGAPGNLPAPGWYADPAGSGYLRWWDGTAWTGYLSAGHLSAGHPGAPANPYRTGRPQISPSTPVYNPFIWLIATLPIIPLISLAFWNPVLRTRTTGLRRVQTMDPASILTLPYLLALGTGLIIYAVSAVLAYLDWQKLRRDGVVRPFHWAWVFLSRELYVIGRSAVVHEAAPRRGLAPVWVTLGMIVLTAALIGIKVSTLITAVAGHTII
ncbi:DUF2510 domain-containing protein [Arthrobacter sp. NPDC080082]|uniref:DUF2510 domain-containing protein n=1 Tax=unclassified Arthrobacter TaxID=235627 RepID=UPI003435A1BD